MAWVWQGRCGGVGEQATTSGGAMRQHVPWRLPSCLRACRAGFGLFGPERAVPGPSTPRDAVPCRAAPSCRLSCQNSRSSTALAFVPCRNDPNSDRAYHASSMSADRAVVWPESSGPVPRSRHNQPFCEVSSRGSGNYPPTAGTVGLSSRCAPVFV